MTLNRFVRIVSVLLLAGILVACATPTASTPTPVASPTPIPSPTPMPSPTPFQAISEGEFTSTALAGNLLGDPATRRFVIYLPPSYPTSDKRYPVVYDLHMYKSNYQLTAGFRTEADYLIQSGAIPEMIVVTSDSSNVYWGSWYMNSPTIGDYETYITSELVAWIDDHYRTIPQPEARGITGCSMGGTGAMRLGLQHPQVYGAIASVSGAYTQAYHRTLHQSRFWLRTIPQTLAEFETQPRMVQPIIAMAAAAAPNPDNPPLYLDMPYTQVDGEFQLVDDVVQKFDAIYPSSALDSYPDQEPQHQSIMLYHGIQDEWTLVEGAQAMSAMLTEKGINHEYLEVTGGHCNLDYEPVVRFMADHLRIE